MNQQEPSVFFADRVCPKCGQLGASIQWCQGIGLHCAVLNYQHLLYFVNYHRGHMDRICERCGYAWVELALDSPSFRTGGQP